MKPLAYLIALCALALAVPAQAKRGNGLTPQQRKQIQEKKKKEEAERKAHEKMRKAVEAVLAKKDSDHDNILTKDEYLTGEADPKAAAAKFTKFDKNNDGSLSKSEIATSLGM